MGKWIQASKIKPGINQRVLACNWNHYIIIAVYNRNFECFVDDSGKFYDDVTHWQKLPDMPKDDIKRNCVICEKEYIPVRANQKFCCSSCREIYSEKKLSPKFGVCPYCSSTFQKKQHRVFCCDDHRIAFYKLIDVKE